MKNMMLRLPISLALICGLVAGCGEVVVFGHTMGEKHSASEAKVDSTATPEAGVTSEVQPQVRIVKSVTLVLTPQAAAKVVDDSRFNADALLAAVKSELKSRKLFDDSDSHAVMAEILLDDYAMHRTSNVILFGNITSAGTLSGNIRLRDEQGNDLQNRRIEAESRVSIPESGESTNPLGPLYRQFAVMTGNILAGTQAKSTDAVDQRAR
jgi:hypothetical protein